MFVPLYKGLFRSYGVHAGPYLVKPAGMPGLKLAPEINADSYMTVDIPDFGLPKSKAEVIGGLTLILSSMASQKPLYVGCRGGLGRTGVMLALAAKALGYSDPVGFVRGVYRARAVETEGQFLYVTHFDVSPLELTALGARYSMFF